MTPLDVSSPTSSASTQDSDISPKFEEIKEKVLKIVKERDSELSSDEKINDSSIERIVVADKKKYTKIIKKSRKLLKRMDLDQGFIFGQKR